MKCAIRRRRLVEGGAVGRMKDAIVLGANESRVKIFLRIIVNRTPLKQNYYHNTQETFLTASMCFVFFPLAIHSKKCSSESILAKAKVSSGKSAAMLGT